MINIWVLDDDILSGNAAKVALEKYDDVSVSHIFQSSEELYRCLENSLPELLILDIELNQELGFDIANDLKEKYPSIMIAFLTGHASYAIDGYSFHPIDFLTKPIRKSKLDSMMKEVRNRLGNEREKPFSVQMMFRLEKGYQIIELNQILYIEHRNRKNYIVCQDAEYRIGNYTMKELEDMVESYGFYQCFQSFIIPLHRVTGIQDIGERLYEIHLEGTNKSIPLSRNKYDELLTKLKSIHIPI